MYIKDIMPRGYFKRLRFYPRRGGTAKQRPEALNMDNPLQAADAARGRDAMHRVSTLPALARTVGGEGDVYPYRTKAEAFARRGLKAHHNPAQRQRPGIDNARPTLRLCLNRD
jgi:hypothetical protein